MKAYFSASSDVGESKKLFYKKIIELLEMTGLNVFQSVFSSLTTQKLSSALDFKYVYNDVLKKIDNADLFIADISDPSGGVGYQVYHAIYSKKPIIIIYSGNDSSNPSVIIRGIKSKKVAILKYDNFNDLSSKLLHAVTKAEKLTKVRFNLVINNRDFTFVEQESIKEGITKTKYLNNLIHEAQRDSIGNDAKIKYGFKISGAGKRATK